MYQNFYKLMEKPFEVTPDTKYLYLTPGYKELLAAILYGIHERRGFIAVVGEVGTGKTMIMNAVLDRLDENVRTAFIYNSDLTTNQMLSMILFELGLVNAGKNISKVKAIQMLHNYAIDVFRDGGNIVIIIDEAQLLNHRTMENLRMLSNLETKKSKLIQFVIAGQPELDKKLSKPDWRQLVQRISLKRYSTEFDENNTYKYIRYRLRVAGKNTGYIFTKDALKKIYLYTNGVPRIINILCDNALLIGYGMKKKKINKEIIDEAIRDMSQSFYIDQLREPIAKKENIYIEDEVIDIEFPEKENRTPGILKVKDDTTNEIEESHLKQPIGKDLTKDGTHAAHPSNLMFTVKVFILVSLVIAIFGVYLAKIL